MGAWLVQANGFLGICRKILRFPSTLTSALDLHCDPVSMFAQKSGPVGIRTQVLGSEGRKDIQTTLRARNLQRIGRVGHHQSKKNGQN